MTRCTMTRTAHRHALPDHPGAVNFEQISIPSKPCRSSHGMRNGGAESTRMHVPEAVCAHVSRAVHAVHVRSSTGSQRAEEPDRANHRTVPEYRNALVRTRHH